MQEYTINVSEVEELQMIRNKEALDKIFERANATIVGGGSVVLVRRRANGQSDKFDAFTTAEDLIAYKKGVYKYLT